MVRRSRNPISVINVFNEIPAYDFLAMGYISANKVPLEKTGAYLFPSKGCFFHPLYQMTTLIQTLLLGHPVWLVSAWQWHHCQSYYLLLCYLQCLFCLFKPNITLFTEIFWWYWQVEPLGLECLCLWHILQFSPYLGYFSWIISDLYAGDQTLW